MWEPGTPVAVRYLDRSGNVMAVLPTRVVVDEGDRVVTWMAPGTAISYWSLEDGRDPREIAVAQRFDRPFITRPRTWEGAGSLRVILMSEGYSVAHLFNGPDDAFSSWHVNLETPKVRAEDRIDMRDLLLDLVVAPDGSFLWRDEDETEAAVTAGWLTPEDAIAARRTGEAVIASLDSWPNAVVGDWRSYRPDPSWRPPPLRPGWMSRT